MKKTFTIFLLSFFAVGLLQAQFCTSGNRFTEQEIFSNSQIDTIKNIRYGVANDLNGNPQNLLMDVYLPATDNAPLRPFVLMMHGGGFVNGSKEQRDLVTMCVELAKRGFVTASINYRLGKADGTEKESLKAVYRANQDARAALRFVVHRASAARIDTSWMFVGGQSAGSVNSHVLIYVDQAEFDSLYLQFDAVPISSILGDLNTSGNPITKPWSLKGLFNNWGSVFGETVDAADMVPTIAFHGELDQTVPIDTSVNGAFGSRVMHQLLVQNNVCSELTVDTLGGHGIYRGAAGALFRAQRTACFFKSVFCNTCTSLYTESTIQPSCSSTPSVSNKMAPEQELTVYPNPFRDQIRLTGNEEALPFKLFNNMGSMVAEGVISDSYTLPAPLPAGMYYFVLSLEDGQSKAFRLLKE